MKGLIVGGGIAGLMSAIAFEREGIDFDIVESASSYKPLGTGIIIPPNAMFILSQYGLDEKVIEHGEVIEHMSMCNHHGASLVYMPCNYDYLGKTLQSVAIPRSQLHSLLLQHLKTPIQMGRKCVDALPIDNGLVVSFNDGSTLESDFIIAADGVNSSIRKSLFSQQKRGNKHRYCWRGLTTLNLPRSLQNGLMEYVGKGFKVGFTPVGSGNVYWYATAPLAMDYASLLKRLSDFPDIVLELISSTPSEHIISHELLSFKPLSKWYTPHCLLIGDAAHPMLPDIGQGGAQAMEDAWHLARILSNCDTPERGFELFQQQRFTRVTKLTKLAERVASASNTALDTGFLGMNRLIRTSSNLLMTRQQNKLYRL